MRKEISRFNVPKDVWIKCDSNGTYVWYTDYKKALQHLTDLHKKQIRQKETTHQKEMSIEREKINNNWLNIYVNFYMFILAGLHKLKLNDTPYIEIGELIKEIKILYEQKTYKS